MKKILFLLLIPFAVMAQQPAVNPFNFASRMGLNDAANVTSATDEFMWGCNVIKVGSTYHAYFERWDNVDGLDGYAYYGKIYHASSSNRLGPFNTQTELTELHGQTWTAGAVVHPVALIWGNKIYLFWIGTTVETPTYPLSGTPARENQRIGVAVTDISTPEGPFTLYSGNPILNPRPAEWDGLMTAAPFPYIARDGTLKMVYKSETIGEPGNLKMGIATASHPEGPWTNAAAPISAVTNIEGGCVWREGEFYYMITKAQDNTYVDSQNGILLYSKTGNADDWNLVTDKTLAFRLTTRSTAITSTARTRIEQAYVLVEDGKAVAFFFTYMATSGLVSFNTGVDLRRDP